MVGVVNFPAARTNAVEAADAADSSGRCSRRTSPGYATEQLCSLDWPAEHGVHPSFTTTPSNGPSLRVHEAWLHRPVIVEAISSSSSRPVTSLRSRSRPVMRRSALRLMLVPPGAAPMCAAPLPVPLHAVSRLSACALHVHPVTQGSPLHPPVIYRQRARGVHVRHF